MVSIREITQADRDSMREIGVRYGDYGVVKRLHSFKAKIWGRISYITEIKGTIEDPDCRYLDIALHDKDGGCFYLTDYKLSHADLYKGFSTGTFEVQIDISEVDPVCHDDYEYREGKHRLIVLNFTPDKATKKKDRALTAPVPDTEEDKDEYGTTRGQGRIKVQERYFAPVDQNNDKSMAAQVNRKPRRCR